MTDAQYIALAKDDLDWLATVESSRLEGIETNDFQHCVAGKLLSNAITLEESQALMLKSALMNSR